jgi:hypothetical protein
LASVNLGTQRPVKFSALPRLEGTDFPLTPRESKAFLELGILGLPQKMRYETLEEVIIRECGGLIGSSRQITNSLKASFKKDSAPFRNSYTSAFVFLTIY